MMMKKMSVLFSAMLLAGSMTFGSMAMTEEDVIGTWYLNTIEMDGEEMSVSLLGMEATIELSEDGTFVIMMTGEDDVTGSWSVDGDEITIDDGENPEVGVLEDGNLRISDDEVTLIFGTELMVEEAYVAAPVIPEPALEDFDGTWNAELYDFWGMQAGPALMGIEMTLTIEGGNAHLYFDDESEVLEKDLVGELNGDTLLLKNPEDPEDIEIYFDTDMINLRLHEDGYMSFSDRDFSEEEAETEAVAEDEAETEGFDMDLTFAVYFAKAE